MRTHLRHRVCDGGEVIADPRTVVTLPGDREWPNNVTIRVPYCERCATVVSVAECDDERLEGR